MRHFLFEDKEYQYKPYFKRRRKEQDSAQALARLLRRFGSSGRKGRSGSGRSGGSYGDRRIDARQKCVAKMNYSNSIEAHRTQLEDYLIREGKGIHGGKPELYGTDIDEYREHMVGRNYRIFLSPQSNNIDLHTLTEQFMIKLEAATGYRLYWQAANHYNTAHHHAHILINGKDQNGKEVEIPRDIVKTFMREYARDICTAQIGNRTNSEMALEKEKELEAQRYVPRLDDRIKDLCSGDTFRLAIGGHMADRERILARLENLRKMNLCIYKDGGYQLSPRWEEDLRANGRYNTFLQARSELKYTDQANLKVYSGEIGTITGRVTKVYRTDDDASDNHAVILETHDGNAWFVPLYKQPIMYDATGKSKVQENDVISIETYATQQGRLTPLMFNDSVSEKRKQFIKDIHSGAVTPKTKKTIGMT